jgi:hypothetical protein
VVWVGGSPQPEFELGTGPADLAEGKKKEVLRKAVVHYHPDRNGKHGDIWRVLSEEITKLLNAHYNHCK